MEKVSALPYILAMTSFRLCCLLLVAVHVLGYVSLFVHLSSGQEELDTTVPGQTLFIRVAACVALVSATRRQDVLLGIGAAGVSVLPVVSIYWECAFLFVQRHVVSMMVLVLGACVAILRLLKYGKYNEYALTFSISLSLLALHEFAALAVCAYATKRMGTSSCIYPQLGWDICALIVVVTLFLQWAIRSNNTGRKWWVMLAIVCAVAVVAKAYANLWIHVTAWKQMGRQCWPELDEPLVYVARVDDMHPQWHELWREYEHFLSVLGSPTPQQMSTMEMMLNSPEWAIVRRYTKSQHAFLMLGKKVPYSFSFKHYSLLSILCIKGNVWFQWMKILNSVTRTPMDKSCFVIDEETSTRFKIASACRHLSTNFTKAYTNILTSYLGDGDSSHESEHCNSPGYNDDLLSTGMFYYPPGGYMSWHTNSMNPVGYRMYFSQMSLGTGEAGFSWVDPRSRVLHTMKSQNGSIGIFPLQRDPVLYHSVWSTDAHRKAFGVRISSKVFKAIRRQRGIYPPIYLE
eukprot:TRINITY_DN4812_c0_g1_i4.p1 TRINITY_DN4812_c0_g1~~TRINITY_DN4812_c0_g1_i4.p1  ORF type:complete len:516 (-),score=4.67 TRINITY_DN4812_c0_g1_i4:3-1550(-)